MTGMHGGVFCTKCIEQVDGLGLSFALQSVPSFTDCREHPHALCNHTLLKSIFLNTGVFWPS